MDGNDAPLAVHQLSFTIQLVLNHERRMAQFFGKELALFGSLCLAIARGKHLHDRWMRVSPAPKIFQKFIKVRSIGKHRLAQTANFDCTAKSVRRVEPTVAGGAEARLEVLLPVRHEHLVGNLSAHELEVLGPCAERRRCQTN